MEKNLSIIQGLTDTDQANPIRITDAGELKVASKQFGLYEIYVADTATLGSETDCFDFVNNSIQDWVSSYGPKYDDLIISGSPADGSKNYLIVTIVRYS